MHDAHTVTLTVLLPPSQYAKVEAAAKESGRSTQETSEILLSEWVSATHPAGKEAK